MSVVLLRDFGLVVRVSVKEGWKLLGWDGKL